ncbi:putative alpha-1,3-glucanase [Talaromyces proteolyticus]|uniref:Alpha-1,3-glucanase n=1 Tax=Talaromyces proteolyticus TaxID=1131652 RepID=A0AAD4KXY1_9EURO|nr:putative alpha-1,3-glucanase [Talaromyces proteolyticus]KAH8702310.1 putative alpha-1,3-glucanase [Talaromyces proteolyticus]
MILLFLLSYVFVFNVAVAAMPKYVFAHYIVGNAAKLTPDQLQSDMELAKQAFIDGFALNIAQQDPSTDAVLQNAYAAAERVGNFSLFLSFDYLSGGPWPVDRVIDTINRYKTSPAQLYYERKPLVSTFEGVGNVDDWPRIREGTGCFAMPDWTSLGPERFANVRDNVDGFFSWDAWPVGKANKSIHNDQEWVNATAGKPYMMPVSPWFYTNLPQWNKNWLWEGAHLWTHRWEEVYHFQPDIVQIISWNDYGESHYIGPIYPDGIPQGAERYVQGNPHDPWRKLLPYYIASYKTASKARIRVTRDTLVFWYRLNPNDSGSNGETTGNCPQQGQPAMDPRLLAEDKIYIAALVKEPSIVLAQIGAGPVTELFASRSGMNTFEVPFGGQTGNTTFAILRDDREVAYATGPAITKQCVDGKVNWNAVVGSN